MRARYRVLSAFLTVVMAFLALGCGYVEHNSLVKADASDLLSSKDRRPFEQVYEEYLLMMEQSPQMLISCPFCGGSGRSDTECKSCNGSGYKTDPNITMFAAFFPCRECAGDGYPKCSECFLGSYMDPDYQLRRGQKHICRHISRCLPSLRVFFSRQIWQMLLVDATPVVGLGPALPAMEMA